MISMSLKTKLYKQTQSIFSFYFLSYDYIINLFDFKDLLVCLISIYFQESQHCFKSLFILSNYLNQKF
jgi:hypothetical protein